jgi:hypothetical protein
MKPSGPYKTYGFTAKDPIIAKLQALIDDEDLQSIHERSGVTVSAMRGWFRGETRRPMHATAVAVARALGHDLKLVRVDE